MIKVVAMSLMISLFVRKLLLFFRLGGGIYLLLGYSSIDEELLRAYTNLGVQDTVRAFQQYLHNHIDNQVRRTTNLSTSTTIHLFLFLFDSDVVHTTSVQYNGREYNNYSKTSKHK